MPQGVAWGGRERRLLLAPLVGAALLFARLPLTGQTVRPVIAEYEQRARGRFELVNDTLVPLNVVLEPKSFDISADGFPHFRPLDRTIHLRLSSMSFRIPAQATYYVFYEATADSYPAWFVVYATFAAAPQQSGLNVQVELPHTVYLLQKQPLEKSAVRIREAEFVPATRRVRVELENSSDRLGRVVRVEVAGRRSTTTHPGFPLLPRSRRKLELEWTRAEPPQKFLVRFGKFVIEGPLRSRKDLETPQ